MTSLGNFFRSDSVRTFVETIEERFPPLRTWHRFEYSNHFFREGSNQTMFHGVFSSFQDARRAVPGGIPSSSNHPNAAGRFQGERGHVWPSDYPVMFWLSRLLGDRGTLFDLGGNIGLSYFAFRRFLGTPEGRRWVTYDVPAVIALAKDSVRAEEAPGLEFTDDFAAASGCTVLLTSGTLQLIETPLSEMLRGLTDLPRHVIINRTPLTTQAAYYTLLNVGPAIYPYGILNRDEFVQSLAGLGYEVVDEWQNADFRCSIPFHPERAVRTYTGMCLSLAVRGGEAAPREKRTSGNVSDGPLSNGSGAPSK